MDKKTYHGPRDVYLVLDPSKIVPDDPGQDTPALVHYQGGTATFTCAVNEGEVENNGRIIQLPDSVMKWLDKVQKIVDKFYDDFYKEYDSAHAAEGKG